MNQKIKKKLIVKRKSMKHINYSIITLSKEFNATVDDFAAVFLDRKIISNSILILTS